MDNEIKHRDAYVRPGEEGTYEEFAEKILTDLLPDGALEMLFATEIVNATWRLYRCQLAEAQLADQTLIDPMLDEEFEKKQRAIDRARAQAHIIIRRSMAELRKLQTERATRRELEIHYPESVLVDTQRVARNVEAACVREDHMARLEQKAQFDELDRMTAPPGMPKGGASHLAEACAGATRELIPEPDLQSSVAD